jgi:hypothetical protein
VPAELIGRESRLKRIQEAKKALEERARAEAEKKGRPPETAKPEKKDQSNFTDPESRIMQGRRMDLCKPTKRRLRWNRSSS